VNVKRAAALVASAIGVLVLAAVVGLGHVATHSVSSPAKATLTAYIYGDSVNVPASTSSSSSSSSTTSSYVDDSSGYTSYYGDGSSTSSTSSSDGSIYGDGSSDIYGDGSSDIYGDSSSSSSSSGSNGVQADIYGD
jgi:hypothetical protein